MVVSSLVVRKPTCCCCCRPSCPVRTFTGTRPPGRAKSRVRTLATVTSICCCSFCCYRALYWRGGGLYFAPVQFHSTEVNCFVRLLCLRARRGLFLQFNGAVSFSGAKILSNSMEGILLGGWIRVNVCTMLVKATKYPCGWMLGDDAE